MFLTALFPIAGGRERRKERRLGKGRGGEGRGGEGRGGKEDPNVHRWMNR